MKFKELPEGYYIIHAVKTYDTVCVEQILNPEKWLDRLLGWVQVVHDGRRYSYRAHLIDDMEVEFIAWGKMPTERKSYGAKLSHIATKLQRKEPLKGKALDLAIKLVTSDNQYSELKEDPIYKEIADNLQIGEPLSDRQLYMMVDIRIKYDRFLLYC